MRPAIFACVNPARFRALSSSSKSANSGSSACLVLSSGFWIGECLFLEFLRRQHFWPPSNAAGLLLIHASAFSVFFGEVVQ